MPFADRTKYAGHDMSDVASLVADGITYECTVYLNRAEWSIDTVCKRVQDDGTRVLVFSNSVDAASAEEIADTENLPLDNPKILAVGTTFVVHWLSADDTIIVGEDGWRDWNLNRASMDMENFSAFFWVDEAAVPIYPDGLYDAHAVEGSTRLLLVYHDSAGPVRFRTYAETDLHMGTGIILSDTIDDSDNAGALIMPRVLACYAHAGDDTGVIVFQHSDISPDFLTVVTIDTTTGAQSNWLTAFPTTGDIDALDYVQAGIKRIGANRVVIAAEAIPAERLGAENDPVTWEHLVLYGTFEVDENTLPVRELWTFVWHYSMCSRPWVWQRTEDESSAYLLVSYRSITSPFEWEQSYQFVVNLDLDRLSEVPGLLRPRIISTVASIGIPDGRTSGWMPDANSFNGTVHQSGPAKRMNHVSSVADGPRAGVEVKTKVVSSMLWSAADYPEVIDVSVSAYAKPTKKPTNASVYNLVVFMEEPWAEYRDATLPEQPNAANFSASNPRAHCQAVEIARSTIFGGGTLHSYDGLRMMELGFLWSPEVHTITMQEIAEGSVAELTSGVRSVYAVYSFRDGAGQWHRSGPSNVQSFTISGTDNSATYLIRTMTGSLKDSLAHYPDADRIAIEVFRTVAGEGVFYKLFASQISYAGVAEYRESNTPLNDATEPYISVYDGMSDDDLTANNVLGPYQFGEVEGIFDPEPAIVPPAMSVLTAWSNRLWGSDSLDPAVLWYSDEILPDFGGAGQFYVAPQFLPDSFFRIGEIGEITAMVGMHNALIVFTETSIRAITIQDVGGGLLNVQVQVLHDNTGCIEPRSVVLAPDGIYFQASKGYHLLSRDHQIAYIGGSVEDTIRASGNIRAASYMRDRHQVRLVLNGAPVPTQTWTFEFSGSSDPGGWDIFGLDAEVQTETGPESTGAEAAEAVFDVLEPLVATTLAHQIASVQLIDVQIIVELVPGLALELSAEGPNGPSDVTVSFEVEVEVFPSVLVFDTLFQRWAVAELPYTVAYDEEHEFLNQTADGIAWGGNGAAESHVVLQQGAVLVQRQPTDALAFADQNHTGDIAVPIDLLTSWFHTAGVAGLQRIWELVIQASKPQASEILIDLDYILNGDYDNPVSETGLTVTDISPAKMRVRPSIQRCTAIRVRIYEAPSGSGTPTTENVRIASITYKVGVKKGPGRVPDTQIAT